MLSYLLQRARFYETRWQIRPQAAICQLPTFFGAARSVDALCDIKYKQNNNDNEFVSPNAYTHMTEVG